MFEYFLFEFYFSTYVATVKKWVDKQAAGDQFVRLLHVPQIWQQKPVWTHQMYIYSVSMCGKRKLEKQIISLHATFQTKGRIICFCVCLSWNFKPSKAWKEYFPNLLETALLCQSLFIELLRDFKCWLIFMELGTVKGN